MDLNQKTRRERPSVKTKPMFLRQKTSASDSNIGKCGSAQQQIRHSTAMQGSKDDEVNAEEQNIELSCSYPHIEMCTDHFSAPDHPDQRDQDPVDAESDHLDTEGSLNNAPRYIFPDPYLPSQDPAGELQAFIWTLKAKVDSERDMFPDVKSQLRYAISRVSPRAWGPFWQYMPEPGQLNLQSLDEFIRVLRENFGEPDRAYRGPLKAQIEFLEARLADLEPSSKSTPLVVSECQFEDWMTFKERRLGQKICALEVLVGKPLFYWQRPHGNSNIHESVFEQKSFQPVRRPELKIDVAAFTKAVQNGKQEMSERIRINSEEVLEILRDVDRDGWAVSEYSRVDSGQSVVFLRPYKYFFAHRESIKARLSKLKEKWAVKAALEAHELGKNSSGDGSAKLDDSLDNDAEIELGNNSTAMRDLDCLMKFLDNFVFPVSDRLRNDSAQHVYFRDLWYLYQPGDEICTSWKNTVRAYSKDEGLSNVHPKKLAVWKVLEVSQGRPILTPSFDDKPHQPPKQRENNFNLACYAIDYDGTTLGPISRVFSIKSFEGERSISTLPVVPLRFVKGRQKLEEDLKRRGEKFLAVAVESYSYRMYLGWTLTRQPDGEPCHRATIPERINGPVIVDFAAAERDDTDWTAQLGLPEELEIDTKEVDEEWPISVINPKSNQDDNEQIQKEMDLIYNDSHIDKYSLDKFIREDKFIAEYESRTDKEPTDSREMSPRDLLLLPNRVCAFLLSQTRFALITVDGLEPVQKQNHGWANLMINQDHKTVIEAVVSFHFRGTARSNLSDQSIRGHDLVRGKGEGLIVLLHGGPGVGKTSTVECLSNKLCKPLLQLSCGNLGDSADLVEESLESLFVKAAEWNCILLLDEADIVLMGRNESNFKQNAVVSVFLRKMEYYQGILFLTTNRVGLIDEAVRSRVHLILLYEPLSDEQVRRVWMNNLKIFKSHPDYKDQIDMDESAIKDGVLPTTHAVDGDAIVNGRMIRNICQMAVAVAQYQSGKGFEMDREVTNPETPDGSCIRLDPEHFKKVIDLYRSFTEYMLKVKGRSENEDAKQKMHRL